MNRASYRQWKRQLILKKYTEELCIARAVKYCGSKGNISYSCWVGSGDSASKDGLSENEKTVLTVAVGELRVRNVQLPFLSVRAHVIDNGV